MIMKLNNEIKCTVLNKKVNNRVGTKSLDSEGWKVREDFVEEKNMWNFNKKLYSKDKVEISKPKALFTNIEYIGHFYRSLPGHFRKEKKKTVESDLL